MKKKVEPTPKGKVYGYIRVSTQDQAISGLGLEAQRRAILNEAAFLSEQGHAWVGIFEDAAVSAKRPFTSREAGGRLHKELKAGDWVLVSKLDRAFRNMKDTVMTLTHWAESGVQIRFVTEHMDMSKNNPIGMAMIWIMATFAEMERTRISERTKEAHASRKARGLPCGQPPRGKKWGNYLSKEFVTNQHVRDVMRVIAVARSEGHSFEWIGRWLRENNIFITAYRPRRLPIPGQDMQHWRRGQVCKMYKSWLAICAHDSLDPLTGVPLVAQVNGVATSPVG